MKLAQAYGGGATLFLIASALLLTACPGNGGASGSFDDGSGETYAGSSSNSSRSYGSGSSTVSISFEDIMRYSNSGNVDELARLFEDSSGGTVEETGGEAGVDVVALSASDLGLPAGGTVTLSITGGVKDYKATATASDDGMVYFLVPRQVVGSEVTVSLIIKKDDGTVVCSGKETLVVREGCQFGIALKNASSVPEDFVFVAGGTFTSANSTLAAAGSQTIADFYICSHEVTQGEYTAVIGSNPSNFTGSPAAGEVQEKRPVEYVSWYDALVYCNKRSMAEGLTPCYSIGGSTDPAVWGSVPTSSSGTWNAATCNFAADGYRLPTEAEWEYAASDGHECSGADMADVGTVAWYANNSGTGGGSYTSGGKTHEVMTKTPNAKGIYDMSGNVEEWCWDLYSSSNRVLRGGSWVHYASDCKVSYRSNYSPLNRFYYLGFRVVRKAD